jgi:vacuolar-type H+-ATPase subunit E/Vma4
MFLEKYITTKFKNKRNERIKELVNNILYAVPYQHFTNSIENYFSMLKSRLQKLDGLTHEKLKENIEKVIKDIPKENMKIYLREHIIEQKNM